MSRRSCGYNASSVPEEALVTHRELERAKSHFVLGEAEHVVGLATPLCLTSDRLTIDELGGLL
jgi:hypothetical protein